MTRMFEGSSVHRTWLLIAGFSTAIAVSAARVDAQAPAPPAPSAAQNAGEFSPIDTRILSDPLFLPRAGQVYGASAFTFNQPTGTNTKNGVETGSFTASDNSFDQTFAYGITNRLAIRVAMGYAANTRDSTAAATGDVTVGNTNGFNDPTFSATYRILDELRSPLILDVTGSYSPDFFAAEAAGGGLNGTVARGGQNAGLAVVLGREMTSFTIAGTMATTHVGEQTTALQSNETQTQSGARWSYDAELNTQTRFATRVSLNAGVTYTTAGNYVVSNLQTGNSHTYDAPATVALNLAFNYHLVPNRLVGSFTYTYETYTEAKNVFSNASADTAVTNRTGNVVGLRFAYTFN